MRRMIGFWIVVSMVLSGCGAQRPDYAHAVETYRREVEDLSPDVLQLQKNLVQWYNLNLRSPLPDAGYGEAYNEILYFGDGILGYIEIPAMELCAPIYHESRRDGFWLESGDPFPTGGQQDGLAFHTDIPLLLADGDLIFLYVLDEVCCYQVCGEGKPACTLYCANTYYEGVYIVED